MTDIGKVSLDLLRVLASIYYWPAKLETWTKLTLIVINTLGPKSDPNINFLLIITGKGYENY